jgi:hypothetical protein
LPYSLLQSTILSDKHPSYPDLDSLIVNMVTFLELPRELRDKILGFVLSHHEDAPTDISDESGRAELEDVNFNAWRADAIMW